MAVDEGQAHAAVFRGERREDTHEDPAAAAHDERQPVAVEQGQHTVAYDRGGGADLFIGDEARRGIAARV